MYSLRLIATAFLAALVVWTANRLALRPWRRSAGAHWTERARLLWPARVSAGWNVVLGGLWAAATGEFVWPGGAGRWWVPALVGVIGGIGGSFWFDREVFPSVTARGWVRNGLAGWGLPMLTAAVLVGAMTTMPSEFNGPAVAISGLALGALLAIRLRLGVLVLRALAIVQPADARALDLVRATSRRLGVQMPGVGLIGGPLAQACALPVQCEVWLSRRLLEICPDDELQSIVAHELAHLSESRLTVAGRVAASVSWWPMVFTPIAVERFGPSGCAGLILLCVGLGWLSRRMSHRLERRADGVAAVAEAQSGVYGAALERLYRENQLPAVNPPGQRTHPSLYDRLTAAGRTPEYPRPRAPRRVAWPTLVLLVLWLLALTYPVVRAGWAGGEFTAPDSRPDLFGGP